MLDAIAIVAIAQASRRIVFLVRRDGWRVLLRLTLGGVLRVASASVPGVAGLVESSQVAALAQLERDLLGDGDADANLALPKRGITAEAVEQMTAAMRAPETAGLKRQWGGIYHADASALTLLQGRVWSQYTCSNALYPGVFPSLRKFEAELVAMGSSLVHGAECGAVGLLASGGTEAILLAGLAYREQARKRGIARPTIIAALSCHPAILKACTYFDMELLKVPLDATMRLTPSAVAHLIDRSTIAIYASAPSFAHGVVDDIEGLSRLAVERGIGLHVDNCLGGFLLSHMAMEGLYSKPWDFALPGVSTISLDVHKYGFAPKGASIALFRDASLRRLTYVPSTDGCEGLYVTPTLQGSRCGATIATAWATLMHIGEEGYRAAARSIAESHARVEAEIAKYPRQLRLVTKADLAVVPVSGVGSFDIYALATLLGERGWGVFTGQKPASMSIPIGEQTHGNLAALFSDLSEAVRHLVEHPQTRPRGNAAIYSAAASLPGEVLDSVLRGYVDLKLQVKPAHGGAKQEE